MNLFDDNPTILEECQLCMHVDHEENFYVIVILLNLNMIPDVVIMREGNIMVEFFMLPNYLSLC